MMLYDAEKTRQDKRREEEGLQYLGCLQPEITHWLGFEGQMKASFWMQL